MPTLADYGIDKLSLDERCDLLHQLEESVEAEAGRATLSDAQRAELDRRIADHEANPHDVVPWEQVKAEALARFRR